MAGDPAMSATVITSHQSLTVGEGTGAKVSRYGGCVAEREWIDEATIRAMEFSRRGPMFSRAWFGLGQPLGTQRLHG